MSAADFVDYTNVTEMEKVEFKLANLMKSISSEAPAEFENCTDYLITREFQFREVDFRLSKIQSKDDPILRGIPHFRFTGPIQKSFDLSDFWLLECVDKHRVVSEATGRLLLGALIQAGRRDEAVFVRLGDMENIGKFLGFRKAAQSEYFETFTGAQGKETTVNETDDSVQSAQVVLEWLPGDLRINFPGFSGYFDAWHPIERVEVKCVWPQIPREGLKFKWHELESAPIWLAEFEESDQIIPLRNSTLRSIQSAHLREVLFTEMGATKMLEILVTRDLKLTTISSSIESVFEAMAQIYRRETEKMEKDFSNSFNFIPKRVQETMRWERINESFSFLWRRFIKSIEEAWNNLAAIDLAGISDDSGEIENSLKLINWCIKRELEWQELLNDHVLLRRLYRIPPRHQYRDKPTIDEKIEEMEGKLASGLEEMRQLTTEDEIVNEEEFVDCAEAEAEDEDDDYERKALGHIRDFVVYEPVVLNCEPPSNKILTKSLLNTPLAGETIALNQLKEDIRVFKAWNKEICGVECFINKLDGRMQMERAKEGDDVVVSLGFIGFLLWHSPNDLEFLDDDGVFVSQRMRDDSGQWINLWRESHIASPAASQSLNLNKQVSFNHRSILGQVLSDLTLKTDLKQLLESATPFVTGRAAELLGCEAEKILEGEIAGGEKYPLDAINAKLDEHEKELTLTLSLEALCGDIFTPRTRRLLVPKDTQRQFLLNKQHEFKVTKNETVRDGMFREMVGGFEGIKVKLPY